MTNAEAIKQRDKYKETVGDIVVSSGIVYSTYIPMYSLPRIPTIEEKEYEEAARYLNELYPETPIPLFQDLSLVKGV